MATAVLTVKGYMYPLKLLGYDSLVNRKLTEAQIEATYRRLYDGTGRVSGRALRAELAREFGSPGKTDRVFAVWRRLDIPRNVTSETSEAAAIRAEGERSLLARLQESETARAAALQRAELAELREVRHQDRWAREIHELREQVGRLAGEGRRRMELEARYLDLRRELASVQRRLADYESAAAYQILPPT